ncbi:HU family DNA-binding protein [Ruminococcus sp.]|uniref:HU family DNA-binding protein n=1 Tax=Ruminococcus sp. TaxID=41978 RepID=UPI0025D6EB0B|nr:HU family DNA-binding protein [Ruminococcus sp.]
MTKAELINLIAEKGEYSKKDAEKALAAVIDAVSDTLAKGDKISLVGFGTFEVRERAEKTAINPRTKEQIKVPAKKVPAFKAGKALKDAVNK